MCSSQHYQLHYITGPNIGNPAGPVHNPPFITKTAACIDTDQAVGQFFDRGIVWVTLSVLARLPATTPTWWYLTQPSIHNRIGCYRRIRQLWYKVTPLPFHSLLRESWFIKDQSLCQTSSWWTNWIWNVCPWATGVMRGGGLRWGKFTPPGHEKKRKFYKGFNALW
jgi:hypothetical protein